MASIVSARNVHAATRTTSGSRSSSTIRQMVTMTATCSEANAAMVCTVPVSQGPARTSIRSASRVSRTDVFGVCGSPANHCGEAYVGPTDGTA